MILSESDINQRISRFPINEERCFTVRPTTSVFLSHKHTERNLMLKIKTFLEHLGISVYIDWLDERMTASTSGRTAQILKQKIREYDKFILVATDGAIDSKWCNWELGLGDAEKYNKDKIALFPIRQENRNWSGAEYLQIYPTIEYFDRQMVLDGKITPAGYYICYPPIAGRRNLISIENWFLK